MREVVDQDKVLQLLMMHAGQFEGERLSNGILGMLRPYRGVLERNLHEVISCLYHLQEQLGSSSIKKELVLSIMSILQTMRDWALSSTSMIRANNLIDDESLLRLGNWYNVIELTSIRYIAGNSHALALYHYLEYLVAYDISEMPAVGAVEAAIEDALFLGEDYQLVAISMCLKYPLIGIKYRSLISRMFLTVPPGDLRTAINAFLQVISQDS